MVSMTVDVDDCGSPGNSVIKIFDFSRLVGWVSSGVCEILKILKFSDFGIFGILDFLIFGIFGFSVMSS